MYTFSAPEMRVVATIVLLLPCPSWDCNLDLNLVGALGTGLDIKIMLAGCKLAVCSCRLEGALMCNVVNPAIL